MRTLQRYPQLHADPRRPPPTLPPSMRIVAPPPRDPASRVSRRPSALRGDEHAVEGRGGGQAPRRATATGLHGGQPDEPCHSSQSSFRSCPRKRRRQRRRLSHRRRTTCERRDRAEAEAATRSPSPLAHAARGSRGNRGRSIREQRLPQRHSQRRTRPHACDRGCDSGGGSGGGETVRVGSAREQRRVERRGAWR